MKNTCMSIVLGLSVLALFLFAPPAESQPPGLEKQGKTPPGFSEGKKTGWEGEYPPGWERKTPQEQEQWRERVREGKERVTRLSRERGLTEQQARSAADAYERAVRRGIDPAEGEDVVEEQVRRGRRGPDLDDSIAEETDRRLRKDRELRERKRPAEETAPGDEERYDNKRSGRGGKSGKQR